MHTPSVVEYAYGTLNGSNRIRFEISRFQPYFMIYDGDGRWHFHFICEVISMTIQVHCYRFFNSNEKSLSLRKTVERKITELRCH